MNFIQQKNFEAVGLVNDWLHQQHPDARHLDAEDFEKLNISKSSTAWFLPLSKLCSCDLVLEVDSAFPYSIPHFFLSDCDYLTRSPHVERRQRLCLAGDHARVDPTDPVAIVADQFREALELIDSNRAGKNREDFHNDFPAYWRRDVTSNVKILGLLSSLRESRLVKAWHGKNFSLVAESEADCRNWLTNRYGKSDERIFTDAAFIWLEGFPTPADYPSTPSEARSLIARMSKDGIRVFDKFMSSMKQSGIVIFASTLPNGSVSTAAIRLRSKPGAKGYGRKKPEHKGFRPGKVPPAILASRRESDRAEFESVDAWQTRLRDNEGIELKHKQVAIVGCGALGSGVARLLLQTGVGSLILVDRESLDWANVCRHELGTDSVGKNKATALAERFRPMYPHVNELRGEPKSWQGVLNQDTEIFRDSDLILALTGDWNAEVALNDLQRSCTDEVNCPIVYCWMEGHAGAAHAVALSSEGACLRCGFSPTGKFNFPVTAWQPGDNLQCGAPTSIYGASDLLPAQSLVTTLALDLLTQRASSPVWRTWIAPRATIDAHGGHWHPSWEATRSPVGAGARMVAAPWDQTAGCSCNR